MTPAETIRAADLEALIERHAEPYRPEPHYVHPFSRRCLTCAATHPLLAPSGEEGGR